MSEKLKAVKRFLRRKFRTTFWVNLRNRKSKLPVVSVRRSNRQVLGFLSSMGNNLAGVSSEKFEGDKSSRAFQAGKLLAEKVKKLGITKVVFNRSGYPVTGRIASFIDGLKKSGLSL